MDSTHGVGVGSRASVLAPLNELLEADQNRRSAICDNYQFLAGKVRNKMGWLEIFYRVPARNGTNWVGRAATRIAMEQTGEAGWQVLDVIGEVVHNGNVAALPVKAPQHGSKPIQLMTGKIEKHRILESCASWLRKSTPSPLDFLTDITSPLPFELVRSEIRRAYPGDYVNEAHF